MAVRSRMAARKTSRGWARAAVAVPDVTGQDPETARTTLADDGWDARVHRLPLPLSGRGESRVLHQSPAAGTALPEGTAVHVWVG